MHRPLATAAVLLAVCLAGACSAPRLGVTPRLGSLDLEGDLGVSSGGPHGTNSLERAGLEEDDAVFGGRVDLRWGVPHLTLSTQSSEHDGSGTLDFGLDDGDVTIAAGEPVASDLELGLHQLLITFDLLPSERFELGLGLGAVVVDLDTSFRSLVDGDRIDTDEVLPIPVLAARLGIDVGRLELSALVGGLALEIDDDEASFVDADLQARLRLLGGDEHLAAHLTAGFRWIDLSVDYQDDDDERVEADLTLEGPYVGLTLSI